VDERLYDVRPPRGREVGAGRAPQRWVEELEQCHLRVDRGDHGARCDALAAVQHHRPHLPAERVDPRHRRRAAQCAAERREAVDERVGQRLWPPRACHCPNRWYAACQNANSAPPGEAGPTLACAANAATGRA
jgi:hypothetical protein